MDNVQWNVLFPNLYKYLNIDIYIYICVCIKNDVIHHVNRGD